ncbi:hypothetical protein [Nitrosopumilus sp.]|uniref:hypothetical protein n=1 Tax=Nitrosopumilus sp. TaxID=2024843 RepID=UPI003D0B11C3
MLRNRVSRSTIIFSALIVGVSLILVPYPHEYTQLAVCSIEGVSGELYYNQGHITAACSTERTWDELFEISGGLMLGSIFLGFFALSLSQKWRIGILSSMPIASFQFTETYIATSKGFMYSHFPHFVPIVWIIIATLAFMVMLYLLPRLTTTIFSKIMKPSAIFLLVLGTINLGFIMHNIFESNEVNLWKVVAIDAAISGVLIIARHKKTSLPVNFNSEIYKKPSRDYSHMYS